MKEEQNAVIPEPLKTGIQYKPGVTARIEPIPEISEISDEEKLFNFAGTIENLSRPVMKTKEGQSTLAPAEGLLTQAIELLRQ